MERGEDGGEGRQFGACNSLSREHCYAVTAKRHLDMTTPDSALPPTREIATRLLPACRCGHAQTGNWPSHGGEDWLVVKPAEAQPNEPPLVEYECLACHRRYRLRGPKFCEVLTDGAERPYMREGRYGRWLSCR